MRIPAPLFYLWVAITIPVVATGVFLYTHLQTPQPYVVTRTVVVTPTASPSATLTPTVPVRELFNRPTVRPTVRTTVK